MKNEGTVDRVIRVLAGIGLLVFFFLGEAPLKYFGLIGAVPLLTGLLGYCPLYSLFGFKTCKDC
jgi:hypothetical protein